MIDNVSELASDTIVLALKELALQMEKESQGTPPPVRGWLEGIGGKRFTFQREGDTTILRKVGTHNTLKN